MSTAIDIPTGTQYPANSSGISNALAAGYRHLRFRMQCAIDFPIDLDDFSGMDFCFEGMYWDTLYWYRAFQGGPLLSASKDIRITMRGLAFYNDAAQYASSGTQVKLDRVSHSVFKNCVFSDLTLTSTLANSGAGLVLGQGAGGYAQHVLLLNSKADQNGHSGFHVENAHNVTFIGCVAQRNGRHGISLAGRTDLTRGVGTIQGCHFEANSASQIGFSNISLANARAVSIKDNWLANSPITLAGSTSHCLVERNLFVASQVDIQNVGTANVSVANVAVP